MPTTNRLPVLYYVDAVAPGIRPGGGVYAYPQGATYSGTTDLVLPHGGSTIVSVPVFHAGTFIALDVGCVVDKINAVSLFPFVVDHIDAANIYVKNTHLTYDVTIAPMTRLLNGANSGVGVAGWYRDPIGVTTALDYISTDVDRYRAYARYYMFDAMYVNASDNAVRIIPDLRGGWVMRT